MSIIDIVDVNVMRVFNSAVGAYPKLDNAIRIIADWYFLRCVPLVAVLWWVWFGRIPSARAKIVAGVTAAAAASFLSRLLQVSLDVHVRPFNLAQHYNLTVPQGIRTDWGAGSSFPSDTTTLHVALATVIFSISYRLGLLAFAWVAFVIALPRIYLTYHWPSDVIAGAALGAGLVVLVQRLPPLIAASERVAHYDVRQPAAFYALAFVISYQITCSFDDCVQLLRLLSSRV